MAKRPKYPSVTLSPERTPPSRPRRQSPLPSPNPSEGAPVRRRSRRGFLARALRRALPSLARAPRAPRVCPLARARARALGDARPRVAGGCWSFGRRAEAAGAAGGAQKREWQARPAAAHARGGARATACAGEALTRPRRASPSADPPAQGAVVSWPCGARAAVKRNQHAARFAGEFAEST